MHKGDLYLGEVVPIGDRLLVVRGVDPVSAQPRLVHLEDTRTAQRFELRLDDLEAGATPEQLLEVPRARRGPDSGRLV